MTGDVVNLRRFRKQKSRADKETTAGENRLSFGRTKAEKSLTQALNEQTERRLDGGRIEGARPEDAKLGDAEPGDT